MEETKPSSQQLHVEGLEYEKDPASQEAAGPENSLEPLKTEVGKERWVVLILTCILMTGIYYSLDIPAALHQQLKDYMPDSTTFEFQFNLLYTVYSLPNVILPFFGGCVVDRLGAPVCLAGFATLCWLGQAIFGFGTFEKSWPLMLAGRVIYGFGGESICVAYSTLLSHWFAGREVALAFGIALAISRLGSVLNNLVSPVVADTFSTPWALWTGVAFNTVSVGTTVLICCIDKKAKKFTTPSPVPRDLEALAEPLLEQETEKVNEPSSPSLKDVTSFGSLFWLLSLSCLVVYGCVLPFNNVASGILLERNFFQAPPADCTLLHPDQCTSGTLQNDTNPATDKFGNACPSSPDYAPVLPNSMNMTDDEPDSFVVDCNDPFWAIGCTRDYCQAQDRATEKAGRVMSIPYILSASMSPVLGHVVDKIGKRAIIASLASVMLIVVHATLAFADGSPIAPLVGQGMAYALYAAVIWPSVILVVPQSLTGTAFGVITSIQNIGLALFPLAIAAIYNGSGKKYIPYVELFFVGCATVGTICGVFLNILDKRMGGMLNSVDAPPHEEGSVSSCSELEGSSRMANTA